MQEGSRSTGPEGEGLNLSCRKGGKGATAKPLAECVGLKGESDLSDEKSIEAAIERWRRAAEDNPFDASARYGLGVAYGQRRMYMEAIAELRRATELAPEDADIRLGLGLMYSQAGFSEEAIEQLNIAASLVPEDADVHASLGHVFMKAGRFDEAIEELKRAAASRPQDKGIYHALGDAYCYKGMYDEAAVEYRKAMRELQLESFRRQTGDQKDSKEKVKARLTKPSKEDTERRTD